MLLRKRWNGPHKAVQLQAPSLGKVFSLFYRFISMRCKFIFYLLEIQYNTKHRHIFYCV